MLRRLAGRSEEGFGYPQYLWITLLVTFRKPSLMPVFAAPFTKCLIFMQ